MKVNLNEYFAVLQNTSIHSLQDLVDFNRAHPDLAYDKGILHMAVHTNIADNGSLSEHPGQEWLDKSLETNLSDAEYQALQAERVVFVQKYGIESIMDKHKLDAVVVPAFTYLVGYNVMSGSCE